MAGLISTKGRRRKLSDTAFGAGERSSKVLSLNINSLLDVMVILLVFLLMNFSTVPQVQLSKAIDLPYSTSNEKMIFAPNVSVSENWIMLDSKPVIAVEEALNTQKVGIPKLEDQFKN